MVTVAVLMSTYNGEETLNQQIDSVLAQSDVNVSLFIRDDGSTDGTKRIINDYSNQYNNIHVIEGENVGVGNSFMQLVYEAGNTYDYYAFCDQDDIWLESKLSRGVTAISDCSVPACYCSNQTLVDKEGHILHERHSNEIVTDYMQILCNNQVTGCTMVWNKELQQLLIEESRRPSVDVLHKRIHDVWVAMVASVIGTIVYDKESLIHYRQHDHNVVGAAKEPVLKLWKKKLSNPELRNGRSALAKEIIKRFGDVIVDENVKTSLHRYADYKESFTQRIALIKDHNIKHYSGETSIMLGIKIILGLF